jgi:hypothetical protein
MTTNEELRRQQRAIEAHTISPTGQQLAVKMEKELELKTRLVAQLEKELAVQQMGLATQKRIWEAKEPESVDAIRRQILQQFRLKSSAQ